MKNLVVVNNPEDWPLDIAGVEVLSARSYLTNRKYFDMRGVKVFNLCRSYRYQSTGYYVSLLAAARGHRPLPSITTIQDLKMPVMTREISEELDELFQTSLAPIRSPEFVLSIYFGRNVAKRYDRLSEKLYKLFPSPFLRAVFVLHEKQQKWILQNVTSLASSEIPKEHVPFVIDVARDYFGKARTGPRRRKIPRYYLAILQNPAESMPPSNGKAIQHFVRSAETVGFGVELVGKEDYGRIGEFDALFIRETTAVNHHTYRFARRAANEGLVVVDDPESILKCTNKVFLAELLERKGIPAPKTMIVHRGNARSVGSMMGLPCILKQPDGSFSRGVMKADTEEELREGVRKLLGPSDLIIAQEFMATPFDWRIGVLDRRPLFACRYYMARRHWQIIKHDTAKNDHVEGMAETLPVEEAPPEVVRTAVRTANLIGDGLYGVDLKQVGRKPYVIEVNDNPNIDAGVEDAVLKEGLYLAVMRFMMRRVEAFKEGRRGA